MFRTVRHRGFREEMRAEYRYLRDNQECLRKDADNGIREVRGECQAGIDGLHDELLGRCKEWRDDVRCMIDLLKRRQLDCILPRTSMLSRFVADHASRMNHSIISPDIALSLAPMLNLLER